MQPSLREAVCLWTVTHEAGRQGRGPAQPTCAWLSGLYAPHWATTSFTGDACVLTSSSRSEGKKPYVPSDVIKANNYLFSLCIHGEIVSTGCDPMYHCISRAGRLLPCAGVLFFFCKWHVSLSLYSGAFNRSRQCLFGGCPGRWSSTVLHGGTFHWCDMRFASAGAVKPSQEPSNPPRRVALVQTVRLMKNDGLFWCYYD